jgi:hypothetical protein
MQGKYRRVTRQLRQAFHHRRRALNQKSIRVRVFHLINRVIVGNNTPANYFSTHPGFTTHEVAHLLDAASGHTGRNTLPGAG